MPLYDILMPCSKSDVEVVYLMPGCSSSLSPVADRAYCSQLSAERVTVPLQTRVCWEGESGRGRTLAKAVKDATEIWEAWSP